MDRQIEGNRKGANSRPQGYESRNGLRQAAMLAIVSTPTGERSYKDVIPVIHDILGDVSDADVAQALDELKADGELLTANGDDGGLIFTLNPDFDPNNHRSTYETVDLPLDFS